MRLVLAVLATLLALPAAGKEAPSVAKQRRKELQRLDRELFNEELLARRDLLGAEPGPRRDRVTELADGSFHAHADKDVLFEKLSAVRIADMSLRGEGSVLLLTLVPATRILTGAMLDPNGPHVATRLRLDVDVDEAGGVREALATVVFLPGQAPTDAEVAECLARYPDQDTRKSRMRCGLPRE